VTALPIEPEIPRITGALTATGAVVVEAPPGAGKTTRVPLALLEAGAAADGRIVLLEPRRIAARASAQRMAETLGEGVGETVGYVTRDERRTSRRTRVEVVTEGILTRRIQRDPGLDGVAVVLFDEFHERSLHADLGLALVLEARQALRPDLRVGVMSATLDGERVAAMIGDCPVVRTEGRAHPVETRWRPRPRRTAPIEPDVAAVVAEALGETTRGDLLVFLPGAREIRRVARRLADDPVAGDPGVLVTPLYGALPPDEQDRALRPVSEGVRKVVLSTDIAETSLTIEGVEVVVDAGLRREPRFDPRTGMSRLVTVPVSQASADQRRGRAGRTAPGICYRLWSPAEQSVLEPFRTPEIQQVDLAGFALEIAAWGASDPDELRLLDSPPRAAYEQARDLLAELGAIGEDGRPTEHGAELVALPVHPRLGQIVVAAREADHGGGESLTGLACELAALLSERDILTTSPVAPNAEISRRVEVLRGADPPGGARMRRGVAARVRREAGRLRRIARAAESGAERSAAPAEKSGRVLAPGFPDRIAQRREAAHGTFLLSNGRGATLPDGDPLAGEDLLVAVDVDAGGTESRIYLAAALDVADLEAVLGDRIVERELVAWDESAGDVVAERQRRFGALVLARAPLDARGDERAIAALLDGVRREGLGLLDWSRDAEDLRARVGLLRRAIGPEWPDFSEEALLDTVDEWLAPFLLRALRRSDLARVPVGDALRSRLKHDQLAVIDDLAPTHLGVPSGSRVRLDYRSRDVPVLPVRVQEMFGATRTPRIAGGRVPVLLRLLSPAQRPVQVTDDLAGFWTRTYPEVRREMRGRYPKHHWPEDPVSARPTSGTRPRDG
jgi:ATP-dependent helicase HrpB